MNTDYDVIIIGSGPAGVLAAKFLSESGKKVAVFDKGTKEDRKCCNGMLSYRSQEFIDKYIGTIPQKIICRNKTLNFRLSKRGLKFEELNSPKNNLNVDRKLFDNWLVSKSNVLVEEESLYLNHTKSNDIINVKIKKNNTISEYLCKYLIGADGSFSSVRRNEDETFDIKKHYIACQIEAEGTSSIPDNYYSGISSKKYSDLYAWFMKKNDSIFLGTTYFLENKNKGYLDRLIKDMNDRFDLNITKELKKEYCLFEAGKESNKPNFFFGSGNVLIAGEASGLLTGIGEGISSALISGKIVSDSILESMKRNIIPLDIYKNKLSDEIKYVVKTYTTLEEY